MYENPEINLEIKESKASYSVEGETCPYISMLLENGICLSSICPGACHKFKNIILPRVSDIPTEISG